MVVNLDSKPVRVDRLVYTFILCLYADKVYKGNGHDWDYKSVATRPKE